MTDAELLFYQLVRVSEGTRKDGFETGGVTLTLNQANDTVTFTGTIPVSIIANSNGSMSILPQDFVNAQGIDPSQT